MSPFPRRWQQVDAHTEDEDEQYPYPEAGRSLTDQCKAARHLVPDRAALYGRQDAEGHACNNRKSQAGEGKLQSGGKPLRNDRADRLGMPHGAPQIASQYLAKEDEVLVDRRLIQSKVSAHGVPLHGVDAAELVGQEQNTRVSLDTGDAENQDGDGEQGRQSHGEPQHEKSGQPLTAPRPLLASC